MAWYRNQGGAVPLFGQASLRSGVAGATDIETADLDADGDLDFAVTARDADRAVWFENRGAGEFPFFRPLPPPLDGALSLVAADLDGDGTVDLAVANENEGSVVRLPNLRALNFVIRGLLGAGGVAASTRFDPQAKALGEWLRSRMADVPVRLL